jgi:sterol desaturase/sphingolipid hydroxylase (fatty acid hydroxylase superfamily)
MDAPPPPAEQTIDLAEPLLAQVGAMGARYDAWVHKSVGPTAAVRLMTPKAEAGDALAARWPQSLRIFRNPALERLSHISWKIIPAIWLPIVAGLLLVSTLGLGLGWVRAMGWMLLGVFGWTLLEYGLHRFVFHWEPKSAIGRKTHFLAHGIHHLDPWDPTRLVFPPLAGIGIAALIYLPLGLLLPATVASAVMAGILLGYIVYDMSHYYTHHVRPKGRWGKAIKVAHQAHHHRWPNRLFGVSSPLWDIVFRTGRP